MITICVLLNFKGTRKEFAGAMLVCIVLDAVYIAPMTIELLSWV
jgi:hypothetical protein